MKKIIFIVFSLLYSCISYSLGLGDLNVHSFLDQPFDAEIEIIDAPTVPITSIKAGVASVEEFEKIGMERTYVLEYLNFTLEKKSSGKTVIHIQSTKHITEPYIQMVVDLAWPNGQIFRAYTILLDPPNYKVVVAKKVKIKKHTVVVTDTSHEEEGQVQDRTVKTSRNEEGHLTYGPTLANESIWQIAQHYKKDDTTLQQVILAILGNNAKAFTEGNLNGLKPEQILIIPADSQISRVPEHLAKMEVIEQDNAWQAKRPINHVLAPPYSETKTEEGNPAESVGQTTASSQLPAIPTETPLNPTINPIIMNAQLPVFANPSAQNAPTSAHAESAMLQKAQSELSIASTAIESVREANILLTEQLKLLQTENKRLSQELQQRDQAIQHLRKDVQLIKKRQGLAAQASTNTEYESSSIWPWLIILFLVLMNLALLAFWWLRLRPRFEHAPVVITDPFVETVPVTKATPIVEPSTIESSAVSAATLVEADTAPAAEKESKFEKGSKFGFLHKIFAKKSTTPPSENEIETSSKDKTSISTETPTDTIHKMGATESEAPIQNSPKSALHGAVTQVNKSEVVPSVEPTVSGPTVSEPTVSEPTVRESRASEPRNDQQLNPVSEGPGAFYEPHLIVDETSNALEPTDLPLVEEVDNDIAQEEMLTKEASVETEERGLIDFTPDTHNNEIMPDTQSFEKTSESSAPQTPAVKGDDNEHVLEFVSEPPPQTAPVQEKEKVVEDSENLIEFNPSDSAPEQKPVIATTKSKKALDTLLDLAKTYISMTDFQAAQQSLEEVVQHGTEDQKREAQALLDKILNNNA